MWHNLPATTISISRTAVTLAVSDRERFADLRADDVILLEIELPTDHGLPRRRLACRCWLTSVWEKPDGTGGLALDVEHMAFCDAQGKAIRSKRDSSLYIV